MAFRSDLLKSLNPLIPHVGQKSSSMAAPKLREPIKVAVSKIVLAKFTSVLGTSNAPKLEANARERQSSD